MVSCAEQISTRSSATGEESATRRPSLKRIVLGMSAEPRITPGSGATARLWVPLVHSGLSVKDADGNLRPVLAETVPTLENGLWKLYPDGRMETTWRLRDGARWHDGAPFTTDDLVFSLQVSRDREMGALSAVEYAVIDAVHA